MSDNKLTDNSASDEGPDGSSDGSIEEGSHILDDKPGMHGKQAYIWFFVLLIAALATLFGLLIPFLNLVSNGTGDSLKSYLLGRTVVADFSLIFVLWGLGWLIGTIYNLIKLRLRYDPANMTK
ncbi:MAG: hypothetical protein ACI9EW_000201 [Cellvibrionaceae bacterium]|jgi:hypothetical protein